ncbi:MAG TPA: hypothetical protein VK667_15620, partial [Ktedonobacteraceae bacterium]|nr:hypothetical protein [Ktedonobacteraceae bacterium]
MEGSDTDTQPEYTFGASCFSKNCRERITAFQEFEKHPGAYSCPMHLRTAKKTVTLLKTECENDNCRNIAIYKARLEVSKSTEEFIWLCEACVRMEGGTFGGKKVVAINRPIPLLSSTTVQLPSVTLESQAETLARLGATDQTPVIDPSNPMYQPLDVTSTSSLLDIRSTAWIIDSSGSESPTGDRSTGLNVPPEIPSATQSKTVTTETIEQNSTPVNMDAPAAKRSRTVIADTMIQDLTPVNLDTNEALSPMVSEATSTPQLYPPATPTTSKPDLKRKNISFADAASGRNREPVEDTITDISPMSATYCDVTEGDLDLRLPPVTDAPFSFWFDLDDTPVSHEALLEYADKHKLVKGLTYRPTSNWVELYCTSAERRDKVENEEHIVNGTKLIPIKARKLAGSRLFVRLAN